MDSSPISFGIFDLSGAIMLVLAGTSFIYLFRINKKTNSSWLLMWFFFCVILSAIATIVTNIGTVWDWAFAPSQDAWLILGGVFLVRFAYSYPDRDQAREGGWMTAFIGLLALAAVSYAASFAIRFLINLPVELNENPAFYLLTPAGILFTVFVFLRRSLHVSDLALHVNETKAGRIKTAFDFLQEPANRPARALRNYGLSLVISLIPVLIVIIKAGLPALMVTFIFNFGVVVAIAALMLTYLNYAPEPISISAKMVGISLVSGLLILGFAGVTVYQMNLGIEEHRLVSIFIGLVLLSSVLITFFFPFFIRSALLEPLEKLIWGVKTANAGNLEIQVETQQGDEVGYLTRAFNNLLASLYRSQLANEVMTNELQLRMEELAASEEKFSKTFHSSPIAMVLQSRDDRKYVDVNAAFSEITGYLREEAIGQSPSELTLYPNSSEAIRVAKAVETAEGRLRNFEFNFQRKSGVPGVGLLSSDFFDVKGKSFAIGIILDITERKQAEDKIRRLNTEMERRVAERSWQLSTLLDLSFLVSHQESADHVFKPAMGRILEISGLQAVCLHTLSSDKLHLSLVVQVGLELEEVDQMCLLSPVGLFASWLSQPKSALIFSDLQSGTLLPNSMKPVRMRSCLVTQLVAQDEVLGILSCYRRDVHTFSLEEVSLLVAVAEQLGISIDNLRLRQEAEQAAVITERQRLARELHDSVTQSLYGLNLFSRASRDALNSGDVRKLMSSLEQIEENTQLALNEMRLMLYQMRPQNLEAGLVHEINARLDQVERRLGIEATCLINEKIAFSKEVEVTLFRITLEALNNSLRHAIASRVTIRLEPEEDGLLLEISDDGQGFDYSDTVEDITYLGMGIKNMRERAAEVGGRLEIVSALGKGTHVRLHLPQGFGENERSEA